MAAPAALIVMERKRRHETRWWIVVEFAHWQDAASTSVMGRVLHRVDGVRYRYGRGIRGVMSGFAGWSRMNARRLTMVLAAVLLAGLLVWSGIIYVNRAAQSRQKKITDLWAIVEANDSKEKGKSALAALDELMTLDPGNTQAKARKAKLTKYSPSFLVAPFDETTARASQHAWANYLGTEAEITNSIGMKLTLIPPGIFTMGAPPDEQWQSDDEGPQHQVTLTKAFYMGEHHVTVGQFRQFVQAAGYQTEAARGTGALISHGMAYKWEANGSWKNVGFPQADDHPVLCVSWLDAVAFGAWLSKKEGKTYLLPTEAQWEYCCRAGTQTAYPWGNNPHDGKGWANCADLTLNDKSPDRFTFNWRDGFVYTSPVGSFRANGFGLYDMIGNALQWCDDWYDAYPAQVVTDPHGTQGHPAHVLRGGSWDHDPAYCRSGKRVSDEPSYRSEYIGFRLVLDSN